MAISVFNKCDTNTEEGGSENHLVHFEEINYVMLSAEEMLHIVILNDENTDSSSSAHDSTSSSDEDNETTLEICYFVAHNICLIK